MASAKRKKTRFKGKALFIGFVTMAAIGVGSVYLYQYLQRDSIGDKPEAPQAEENVEQPAAKELFEEYYGQATELLNGLTLEEKVGQLFLVRCPAEDAIEAVTKYHLGGFVLFAGDFENRTEKEVKDKLLGFQAASKTPMILAVDEEGGSVIRVSKNPNLAEKPFQSPQELYAQGGLEAISKDAKNKSILLKQLGINLNLSPVADVSTNPDDYIYKRTFGKSAAQTAEYVARVVNTMKDERLSCTLKHFPGYGNNKNTHEEIAVDTRPYSSFTESDFLPFSAGIEAGAQSIMVSHTVVLSMDETLPASLSPKVHKVLRDELGFSGVVMTDDLSMKAIQLFVKSESPAVLAIKAGNELLIESDFEREYEAVLAAVQNGEIKEEQIDAAVLKVLAWKCWMGLISE